MRTTSLSLISTSKVIAQIMILVRITEQRMPMNQRKLYFRMPPRRMEEDRKAQKRMKITMLTMNGNRHISPNLKSLMVHHTKISNYQVTQDTKVPQSLHMVIMITVEVITIFTVMVIHKIVCMELIKGEMVHPSQRRKVEINPSRSLRI